MTTAPAAPTTRLQLSVVPDKMAPVSHTSRTLIGRDAEVGQLLTQLGLAPGEEPRPGRHVLLSGDAGVGKTRLLQELGERARERGWQVYVGHALDLGDSALPYLPFSELIDRVAARNPEIVEQLGTTYPDLARLQPVRRVLGSGAAAPAGEADRAQLFEGVQALLEQLAADLPTLVVVEDVHWADRSTRDLLTYLFTRPFAGPVAIVASYRADDLHRRHPLRAQVAEWSRLGGVDRLSLGPLGDEEVRALVGELDPAATERETREIVARAEGNAFFVEELVGAAAGGPDRWVPEELADVLLVRLDRLDDTAREVVRTASVAGRRVTHSVLAEVTGLDDDDLDGALRHAIESHVLVAGDGVYSFRHALLGEAVYDDLLPGQRARLHARYAAALSSGRARGTAAELARHALQANDLDTALAASIRAGDEAATIGGPDEAAMHFERALQLLADPQRSLPEGDTVVRVAEATVSALMAAGQTERAGRVARDQLERLPAGGSDDDRARLLTAEAVALGLLDSSEAPDAVPVSEQAVAASEKAEPPLRARVLANHAQVLHWCGRHEDAERWGLEALAFAERHNLPKIASAVVTTLSSLGKSGDPDQFRTAVRAAIDRAVASGALAAELHGRYVLARSFQDAGEWPEAEVAFRSVVERAERSGQPWAPYAFESRHQLAWVLSLLGRWDEALDLLRIAAPGAPPLPYAALDSLRLAIRQARGEQVPRRVHRSSWSVDGFVVIFAAGVEIRAAETATAAVARYDEAVAALTRIWGPRFAGRVRLAATALGRLADVVGDAPAAARAGIGVDAARLLDDAATARGEAEDGRGWGPEGQAWSQRAVAEAMRVRWLCGHDAPTAEELLAAWREAERLFAAFGHVHELAVVRTVLAEVLRSTGDLAGVRATAGLARTAAVTLGAAPLLRRLDALGVAGAPDSSPTSSPSSAGAPTPSLTAREAEILALVAEGRTNGEIGKRLFISTKTVSVHVSNVLAKLGAASRTEAAAIARRRGLLD